MRDDFSRANQQMKEIALDRDPSLDRASIFPDGGGRRLYDRWCTRFPGMRNGVDLVKIRLLAQDVTGEEPRFGEATEMLEVEAVLILDILLNQSARECQ